MGRYITVLVLAASVFCSCIRPDVEDCPPLTISIEVEDKNYSNIEDVETLLGKPIAKDVNLPFRNFISTICYEVRNENGEIVARLHNQAVEGDDAAMVVTLPVDVPYGKYSITAWGNLESETPLSEDMVEADLETDGSALCDVYLGSLDMDYQYGKEDYRLPMKRTEGGLVVMVEGVSDAMDYSEKTITNVYTTVDTDWQYGEVENIQTKTHWQTQGGAITYTPVPPTAEGMETTLSLLIKDTDVQAVANEPQPEDADGLIEVSPIAIWMERNKLTILKYDLVDREHIDVYVMVDDTWKKVHSMIVD